jgi:hypothetical protein
MSSDIIAKVCFGDIIVISVTLIKTIWTCDVMFKDVDMDPSHHIFLLDDSGHC